MDWDQYNTDMAERLGFTQKDLERIEALRAQADREELARLKEQYSGWLEHKKVFVINATPADLLNLLAFYRQRAIPRFPQDPTVDSWGDLGIDCYETNSRHGGPADGFMWRCLPFTLDNPPEPGTGVPVSTVHIEACAVTATPARTRVELTLEGPHLGRWYEALQTFILESYPEAAEGQRAQLTEEGSTSSTTQPAGAEDLVELSAAEELMLEKWRESYTAEEVAEWPGIPWSAGTVRNKLTQLRNKLGVERVPYHRK